MLGIISALAIVGIGGTLAVLQWNSKNHHQQTAIDDHQQRSTTEEKPAFSTTPDGNTATNPRSATGGGTNQILTAATERVSLPVELKVRDDETLYGIAVAPDGRGLAAATIYGLTHWDFNTGKVSRFEHLSHSDNCRLYYSPGGRHVALVSRDVQTYQRVRGAVWSLADGKKICEFEYPDAPNGFELTIAFSPNGTYFAVPTSDHGIAVSNLTLGREVARLHGHSAKVGALLFSADEKTLFSGSSDVTDGTLRKWNLETLDDGRVIARGEAVSALAATPDGRTLISSSFGKVKQWDIRDTGLASLKYEIPEAAATLHISDDGKTLRLVSSSRVASWSLIDGKLVGRLLMVSISPPDQELYSNLSPDGRALCVVSRNAVALWDVPSAQRRTEYPNPANSGNPIATVMSADGAMLAAAYQSGTIRLIPLEASVASAASTLALKSGVRGLKFSADGKTLALDLIPNAVNDQDAALTLAQREGGKAFEALARKHGEAKAKMLQDKNNVGPGESATAWIKRPQTQELFKERFGRPQQEFLAALVQQLQNDHAQEFPWGEMGAIWRIGDASAAVVLAQPPLARDEFLFNASDYSKATFPSSLDPAGPQGAGNLSLIPPVALHHERLVWVHRQQGIAAIDLDARKPDSLRQADLEIRSWLLSPDGNTLFLKGQRKAKAPTNDTISSESPQPVCAFLDLKTKELRPVPVDRLGGEFLQACFTPDSKRLLAKSDGTPLERESRQTSIRQWNVATGTEVGKPILFSSAESVREMVVSPDGKLLAVVRGHQNMNLHLIDLATGQERPTTAPEHVALPTFSPDSRTLAIVVTGYNSAKHQIELIDRDSGQSRASVDGWNSYVQALAFSPDSRILAIGGGRLESRGHHHLTMRLYPYGLNASSELKLIDAENGKVLAPLGGHDDLITCLEFSPDGKTLATGGVDRTVKVWDVEASIKGTPQSPTLLVTLPSPTSSGPASPATSPPEAMSPTTSPTPAKSTNLPQPKTGLYPSETNSIGMKLVVLPAGEFLMGSPASDIDSEAEERPQHKVHLTRPFAIGIHEVTVGQFRAFVAATGYQTDGENSGGGTGYDATRRQFIEEFRPEYSWQNIGTEQTDDHPVTNISWNDAKAFCNWLSAKETKRYRLPTEAEWEYACRAGTNSRFPTGNDGATLKGAANVGDSSLRKFWGAADWTTDWDDGYPFTSPVGSFKANAWGIHDMIGNVGEWCEDRHDTAYYANSPDTDPRGPAVGEFRVARGGGWYNAPVHQRPAHRGAPDWPTWARSVVIGFRIVRAE